MLIFKEPQRRRLETASFSQARIWAATTLAGKAHYAVGPSLVKQFAML